MARYHINEKGEPGQCRAEKGGCPFGSPSDHHDSPEQARKAFENSMTSTPAPLKRGKQAKPTFPYDPNAVRDPQDGTLEFARFKHQDGDYVLDKYAKGCFAISKDVQGAEDLTRFAYDGDPTDREAIESYAKAAMEGRAHFPTPPPFEDDRGFELQPGFDFLKENAKASALEESYTDDNGHLEYSSFKHKDDSYVLERYSKGCFAVSTGMRGSEDLTRFAYDGDPTDREALKAYARAAMEGKAHLPTPPPFEDDRGFELPPNYDFLKEISKVPEAPKPARKREEYVDESVDVSGNVVSHNFEHNLYDFSVKKNSDNTFSVSDDGGEALSFTHDGDPKDKEAIQSSAIAALTKRFWS